MPIWEYSCNTCSITEERIVNIAVRDKQFCVKCDKLMKRKKDWARKFIRKDGFWSGNDYQNQTKVDLDAALKENDYHRARGDKLINAEMKEGLHDGNTM